MSKKNKKRTKRYAGEDAKHLKGPASDGPVIHHYSAVQRNAFGQWWFEKKRAVKIIATVVVIVLLVVWLIFEALRIIL